MKIDEMEPKPTETNVTNEQMNEEMRQKIDSQTIYYSHTEQIDLNSVDNETDTLDFSLTRLSLIEDYSRFRRLTSICFRSNLIKSLKTDNLKAEKLTSIRELDFYDNQIEQIECLDELTQLEVLDLSFNRIKKIENLHKLENLIRLYFANNQISKIENLENLKKLEILELGANQLRSIQNLESQTQLKQL